MQQEPTREAVVVVHQAGTCTEALVIRGLLESAGIASPAPTSMDPYPLRQPPKGMLGVEILALASQADEARRIIADYQESAASSSADAAGDAGE